MKNKNKTKYINSINNDVILAKYLYAPSSSRKLRILANIMQGKNVQEVLINLKFINTKAAFLIKKVIKSAVANAKHNNKIKNITNLLLKKIMVNEGPKKKKLFPRAKGKTDFLIKKTCHITIELIKLNPNNK